MSHSLTPLLGVRRNNLSLFLRQDASLASLRQAREMRVEGLGHTPFARGGAPWVFLAGMRLRRGNSAVAVQRS